eukprot:916609-Rhodomonas_salina.2
METRSCTCSTSFSSAEPTRMRATATDSYVHATAFSSALSFCIRSSCFTFPSCDTWTLVDTGAYSPYPVQTPLDLCDDPEARKLLRDAFSGQGALREARWGPSGHPPQPDVPLSLHEQAMQVAPHTPRFAWIACHSSVETRTDARPVGGGSPDHARGAAGVRDPQGQEGVHQPRRVPRVPNRSVSDPAFPRHNLRINVAAHGTELARSDCVSGVVCRRGGDSAVPRQQRFRAHVLQLRGQGGLEPLDPQRPLCVSRRPFPFVGALQYNFTLVNTRRRLARSLEHCPVTWASKAPCLHLQAVSEPRPSILT